MREMVNSGVGEQENDRYGIPRFELHEVDAAILRWISDRVADEIGVIAEVLKNAS